MIGPANPLAPLGTPEKLRDNVSVQHFADGRLYQLAIERGATLYSLYTTTDAIPTQDYARAVWSSVHSPWDIGEVQDSDLYMTLWCADE